ncbi:hypothetical protein XvhCFBP2543_00855 [Xanthomonas vasicola]|uniref:Integrase n=1 Tax=Xanthomonas vasicola TaxID=56459 RepID=A0ABD7SE37_XANVA|nr:hypothetical protein NX81_021570 [Xanthomonas vasicola]PPV04466.1 hypothetical protein XvhCFBP2543_00855 [Xanthomonas vasicola]TWQ29820.1 hypothetical protein FQJ97_21505 [Xanthomonas vasicola]TWQ40846.1 hypothetical protein FQJ96_05020 [Xanthomonas vasicola]TWQ56441.1 hypothetical protein FQK01_02655 [Xanthomonas vasicola]
MHTDRRHWSLPAHHRGTLGGMDAAKELTRTYLQRVLRWWAGKDPAAKSQISCLQPELRVSQPAAKVRPFALQQTGVP